MPRAIGQIKECGSCHVIKTIDDFNPAPHRPDGFRPNCKECLAKRSKELRRKRSGRSEIDIPGTKFCTGCKTTKTAEEFCKNSENLSGLNRHCKECVSKQFAERRKKYAASVAVLRADGKKRCKSCKDHRPIEEFHKNRTNRDHLNDHCRECSYLRQTHRYLRMKYGITLTQYQTMSEAQGHVCYLCGQPEIMVTSSGGRVNRLTVDHDHKTGKVRGLLCNKCNLGVAQFEYLLENGLLLKTAKYLKHHRALGLLTCEHRESQMVTQ